MQTERESDFERNTDLFQNLELAIRSTDAHAEDMSDYTVRDAMDALIRAYNFEAKGKKEYRPPKLSGQEGELYENMRQMCEWRLGRAQLEDLEFLHDHGRPLHQTGPVRVEAILRCLRVMHRSREQSTESGGRRGFLNSLAEDHHHDHGHDHDHGHHHH